MKRAKAALSALSSPLHLNKRKDGCIMKKFMSLLLIIILSVTAFSACNSDGIKIRVFFKNSSKNELRAEMRTVKADKDASARTIARLAVNELIKGPKEEGNLAIINKSAKLISLAVNENVATVNISKHYLQKKGVDELILRFAIVNTLCDIKGIDGVVIQVEGNNLVSETTGKEIGVLRMDGNIVFAPEDKLAVTLYFPDKGFEHLSGEIRRIDVQNALSLEKIVVDELLKGPQSSELSASLPQGTKLLSVEVKDKVCFVNFSKEFASATGSASTTMALYSVVNSLCTLRNIESVQILVNGEAGVEFGNFVLDIPYEANFSLVE